jgi:hypothetical protein
MQQAFRANREGVGHIRAEDFHKDIANRYRNVLEKMPDGRKYVRH